jgi:hypothetical protein
VFKIIYFHILNIVKFGLIHLQLIATWTISQKKKKKHWGVLIVIYAYENHLILTKLLYAHFDAYET